MFHARRGAGALQHPARRATHTADHHSGGTRMSATPKVIELSRAERRDHPRATRRRWVKGALGGSVLVVALVAGILPRMAQRQRLAASGALAGRTPPPADGQSARRRTA